VAGQRPSHWSGSGADSRDPQAFGALITGLVRDRGWERPTAEASVLGRWGQLVGAGIAEHSQPVSLRDGALVVAAESTAWATQLRLLAPRILQRLRSQLGPDIVTSLRVHGPTAPSWKKGPRSVRGRGPRDTYG
jgi:predicted nucleic acid-binding Zn ribbon protein